MEGPCDLVTYSYEELKSITRKFSSENFIGNSHFGNLYCGKIQDALDSQEEVIVKIWVDSPTPAGDHELQQSRFKNEIKLLTDSDIRSHPNMIKLMGYCNENGHLGVVYKQKPLDTLFNMLYRDELKWVDLVKVAFTFAFLLKQFQDGGLWLRNIDASYLLVDQTSNPILFDFSTLVGGDFGPVPPSENIKTDGCFNLYTVDPHLRMTGKWAGQSDVFSYGFLLSMFAKRRYERDVGSLPVHTWAIREYWVRKGGSLAHTSFEADPLMPAME